MATSGSAADALAYIRDATPASTGWAQEIIKSAVGTQDWSTAWATTAGQSLSEGLRARLRNVSVLDAVAVHALRPDYPNPARMLTGGAASSADEGGVKVATKFSLTAPDMSANGHKIAALVAMSKELLRLPEANQIITDELAAVVADKVNSEFLGALTATSVTAPTSGSATDCVQAALDAVDDSDQVVLAAPRAFVRKLAAESDGRIGLIGGELFPGCRVIATTAAGNNLYAIPADRAFVYERPVVLSPASEASVELDDAPTGGATSLVSLWQENLVGLLCERSFWVKAAAAVMAVQS